MWSDLLFMSYDDFKVSDDDAHLLSAQVIAFKDYVVTEMTKIDAESNSAVHLTSTKNQAAKRTHSTIGPAVFSCRRWCPRSSKEPSLLPAKHNENFWSLVPRIAILSSIPQRNTSIEKIDPDESLAKNTTFYAKEFR